MKLHTSQPKEPTLTTVVSLVTKLQDSLLSIRDELFSVRDELKNELHSELKDIRETVEFIKENAVTKDELMAVDSKIDRVKQELKDEMVDFKNEVISHVDHFVQLHKKQDVELVALAHRLDRHEKTKH